MFRLFLLLSVPIFGSNRIYGQQLLPLRHSQPTATVRTTYECEVTGYIRDYRPDLVQSTLSKNGELALINDTLAEKTLLVETKTSKVTGLKIKNPVCAVWFDSESDYVYTVSLKKKIDFYAEKFSPADGDYHQLCCYENIEALKQETVLWQSNNPYSTVWWIPGNQNRIRLLLSRNFGVTPQKDCTVIVENVNGQQIATHSVQGMVVGIDGDEGQILVYHVAGNRSGKRTLQCTVLSANGKESNRPKTIGPYTFAVGWNMNNTISGTRPYRLRGLKSGDVSYYFTRLLTNKSYWQFQDFENVGVNLSSLLRWRRSIHGWGRLSTLNKSASISDVAAFEIFPSATLQSSFLVNHHGDFAEVPCPAIFDAVFDDSKAVILGQESNSNRPTSTIRIMTMEKSQAR